MCHPDEKVALDRGLEGGNFFGYSLGHYYVFGEHRPGSTDVWTEYLERRGDQGYSPEIETALRQERLGAKLAAGERTGLRGATGTPQQVRDYLQRFEQAGVDQVIFVLQAGKNRHEHICESLELFGREVLPAFKERDEAQVHAKAASGRRSMRHSSGGRAGRRHRFSPRTTPSPPCPADGPMRRGAKRSNSGWNTSLTPGPRASGSRDWGSWATDPDRRPRSHRRLPASSHPSC